MWFIKEMTAEEVQYYPTKDEIQNLRRKEGCFKVSGDRVFATLQGEGLNESEGGTAGCPAVFFRLHLCNLHCGFPRGWQCDTGYTWDTRRQEFWKEPEDWTLEKTKKEIEDALNAFNLKLSEEYPAVELRAAYNTLGEIIGENTGEDILNGIFRKFCVGK